MIPGSATSLFHSVNSKSLSLPSSPVELLLHCIGRFFVALFN